MLTWVIYDISKNSTRTKVADRCLDYGLYRVQKSVFLGDLESNRVDEVILFSKELLNKEADSMYVFPCAATISARCESSGKASMASWSRMNC